MYTIGDFLIQLKNAYNARKKQIEYPHSAVVSSIGKILEKEGYISKLKVKSEKLPVRKSQGEKVGSERKILEIELKYENKEPAISDIKLISRPSIHYYVGKSEIKRRVPSHATGIISTSLGIMTTRDAQKKGVGGELICQIY